MVLNTSLGPYYSSILNDGQEAPAENDRTDYFWQCPLGPDHAFIGSPRELLRQHNANPETSVCKVCKLSGFGRGQFGVYYSITSPTLAIAMRTDIDLSQILTGLDPQFCQDAEMSHAVESDPVLVWRCPQGPDHVYVRKLSHEMEGRECSVCCGVQTGIDNSLATYCRKTGFNRPIQEWHPVLNGDKTPLDVTLVDRTGIFWKAHGGPDLVWLSPGRERLHNFRNCTEAQASTILDQLSDDVFTEQQSENLGTILLGNGATRSMSISKAIEFVYPLAGTAIIDEILEIRIGSNPFTSRSPGELSITNSFFGIHPDLRLQIHPILNEVEVEVCFPSSEQDIWWKCPTYPDHEWVTTPSARHHEGTGCWYCANAFVRVVEGAHQGISISNSIANHPAFEHNMWGQNSQIPELIRYGSRTPRNWVCLEDTGHPEWPAAPNNRLLRSGCMACFEAERHPTQERLRGIIQESLPWLCPSDRPRSAFGLEYEGENRGQPKFDIVLREDIRAVIEYQSEIHDTVISGSRYRGEEGLQEREDRDSEKRSACESANPPVLLIEVWHRYSQSGPTWDQRTLESLLEVFSYYDFDPEEYRIIPDSSQQT